MVARIKTLVQVKVMGWVVAKVRMEFLYFGKTFPDANPIRVVVKLSEFGEPARRLFRISQGVFQVNSWHLDKKTGEKKCLLLQELGKKTKVGGVLTETYVEPIRTIFFP